jgi:hypothetical protein
LKWSNGKTWKISINHGMTEFIKVL